MSFRKPSSSSCDISPKKITSTFADATVTGDVPPRRSAKTLLWLKGCALGRLRAELTRRGLPHTGAAERGGLVALLLESVSFKNPAERLAFAIAQRNPAASAGQERVLRKLRDLPKSVFSDVTYGTSMVNGATCEN